MALSSPIKKFKEHPLRFHWLAFLGVCVIFYTFFAHPDVIETSNHSYLMLESIFSGRFMHFYTDVMQHQNPLYYINNAHYNIIVYFIFALAELPVFIFNAIFKTAVNETLLYYIGKLVSAAFFAGCIVVVGRIARQIGINEKNSRWAALFFALCPAAFFSALVMGQYDSICLLFLLLGLLYWLRGDLWRCTLWMGVGAACKFFPLLLLVPLVLLAEKRPLHILKYGAVSLWLVLPTSLLFMGRTGDMALFNNIMVSRLFTAKLPAAADIPLFPLIYVILCFAAYLYKPHEEAKNRAGLWFCLAVLSSFFFFVEWHPQWIILLIPFLLLTTFMEKHKLSWFWLDLVFSAGFFLFCALAYPRQLEANMLDFGLLGLASGLKTTGVPEYNAISFYYNLLPVVSALPMVLLGACILAQVILKFPLKSGTLGGRLAQNTALPKDKYLPFFAWGLFGAGMAVWLLPTLFTWLKCFSFI